MQRDAQTLPKSMYYGLGDGPANALALSKDNAHVVVAGRNVFKILAVEEDSFVEKLNLRVGKNLNLNYSCNDVVWSHVDDNLIATGATNGAVVLWNLSKITRAKQEHVFTDHQRTVHRVLFHPSDQNILLSGSQDGTVKFFDMRAKEAKLTFKSNSESVRDVQFVPKNSFSFTSVSENGSVQLWDVRKGGERPYLTFTAHSGPVFSCDWHPDSNLVLATAGRDRTIKVWSISNVATLDHTIQTVASVGRVKWRPSRKNHIGSTSLVVDASVCVWDIRRPFVPFASFEKHTDVATGIVWKSSPHVFLSTSKDCTVWQHIFKDASRPSSKAIPQALALSVRRGEVTQAVKAKPEEENNIKMSLFKKSSSLVHEQFHMAESHLYMFEVEKYIKEPFRVECAQKYLLRGKPPIEMCEKNAQLALSLDLQPVALVWEIAKLFCKTKIDEVQEPSKATDQIMTTPPKEDHEDQISDEDVNNNSSSETEKQDLLAEIASGLHINQNLFMHPQHGPTYDFQVQPDWQILPAEAFQPRHEIREGSSSIHLEDCSPRDVEETLETVAIENRTSHLRIFNVQSPPEFDFSIPLMEALHFHAKQGDVQTSVSVWLVLSNIYKLPIDSYILETWCWAYVEHLQRYRLYATAALIIKQSVVLGHLSQQSTLFLVCCGICGKPLGKRDGNYCEKCHKSVAKCSICHSSVKGLMSWCQGCGHGGHVIHLQRWFNKHNECPVGCGHLCQQE